MTDATVRRGWLVSATSLALWAASTLSLVVYAVVIGPDGTQQQAAELLARRPFEAATDPLIALVGSTTALGALTVLSLLYYVYTQWQYARRRRRTLEG